MSETIIKKSIFEQQTYLRVYEPILQYLPTEDLYRKYYGTHTLTKVCNEILQDESIITTIDLLMPLLEINSKFYIEELDETVVIKEVIRTSKGNVLYMVESKYIDDEESLKNVESLVESDEYRRSIDRGYEDRYFNLMKVVDNYNEFNPIKRLFNEVEYDKEN